ncbi:creatininase family protein [Amycolatopsis anabasis]|uniref:creatininase family protein n=1 Tax=Amycolatopsis anabasis TaxID=1840409 RepID=UPI00131CC453|nr:creatininase family protein [Amycolatopsis anabasis]
MTLLRWAECTRTQLRAVLPDALVVLPMGATEQHGPHLATGTDALIADMVTRFAAARAIESAHRHLVLTPCLRFGASDHHLPFGGTLSLSVDTAIGVLTDLGTSIAASGGRRLVIVNGHGGNRGVCHAAAAKLSARHDLAVAVVHYWELLPAVEDTPVPGHAGEFETAMVLALRPELVGERFARPGPVETFAAPGVEVHDAAAWQRIDGYTDEPARATRERGTEWLEGCVSALANRLIELARVE